MAVPKLQDNEKYKFASEKPRKQIFADNLIGGLAWGVGSILGATIIVGLLGLFIARSRNIPLIGDVVNVIIEEINQGRNSNIFNSSQTINDSSPSTTNTPQVVLPQTVSYTR